MGNGGIKRIGIPEEQAVIWAAVWRVRKGEGCDGFRKLKWREGGIEGAEVAECGIPCFGQQGISGQGEEVGL